MSCYAVKMDDATSPAPRFDGTGDSCVCRQGQTIQSASSACAARARQLVWSRRRIRRANVPLSGQRFDKDKLTAAHFDLPFGTRIRVRNLRNDRRVDLTITDRFPVETLKKGRILDVSYGAAKKLRMVEEGVVPVELTVRA